MCKNLLDKNNQIFVVTVIHNNEIIAIAPLRIETVENFFYSTRIIKFLSIGDYNSFLFNESLNIKYDNVYFEIFKAIDEKNHLWDSISLNLISHKSRLIKYFFRKNIKSSNLNVIAENAFFDIYKYNKLNHNKSTNRYYNNFKNNIDTSLL